jgi:nucleoside-diphosphate-sugar epimerase
MTTILITGASGFIARHLAQRLALSEAPDAWVNGLRVLGVSRQARDLSGFERIYQASLGESLQSVFAAEKVDAVVHCALAEGPGAYELNVSGTTRWLDEARSAGVGLQIFLSTLSATADAPSDYGRAKYVLEQRFVAAGEVVFRLGVVVGDGGMFGRLRESVRRSPIVPLLDGGRQFVYILGIGCLCSILRDCILCNGAGLAGRAWNPHLPRAYTLREVIRAIVRCYGYWRLLLPIPSRPILALLLAAEKLPFLPLTGIFDKLPVTSANVRGLIKQGRQHIPSDFARFGYPESNLDDLIGQA